MASIKRSIITHESLSKKILADDGTQYMACCCEPSPTPTPTPTPTPSPTPCSRYINTSFPNDCCYRQSLDVIIDSDISGCISAGTYTCHYRDKSANYCVFDFGNDIGVRWYFGNSAPYIIGDIRVVIPTCYDEHTNERCCDFLPVDIDENVTVDYT